MALDVEYQGDIYDENDTDKIDCKYIGYWVSQDKWSDDVYDSEKGQYSINAGSDSELTQDGSMSDGDILILIFWQDGDTRSGSHSRFSAIEIVYDGSDTYVQNVQLIPSVKPSCVWSLPTEWTLGDEFSASSSSSDSYQWTYADCTHIHYNSWYGQTIFDNVGIDKIEYDFSSGYNTENKHTFDEINDYTVKHKSTNKYADENECEKTIRIKYHTPIVTLTNDPTKPKKDEDTTIDISNNDVDDRITEQTYTIDDTDTTELTHSFSDVDDHYFKVLTKWNDGYDDLEFTTTLKIEIEAKPPEVSLSHSSDEDTYTFTADITEGDGEIDTINYKVYYRTPIDDALRLVFNSDDDETIDFSLSESGYYKVVVYVVDDQGKSGEDIEEIELSNNSEECPECEECKSPTKWKMRFDVE